MEKKIEEKGNEKIEKLIDVFSDHIANIEKVNKKIENVSLEINGVVDLLENNSVLEFKEKLNEINTTLSQNTLAMKNISPEFLKNLEQIKLVKSEIDEFYKKFEANKSMLLDRTEAVEETNKSLNSFLSKMQVATKNMDEILKKSQSIDQTEIDKMIQEINKKVQTVNVDITQVNNKMDSFKGEMANSVANIEAQMKVLSASVEKSTSDINEVMSQLSMITNNRITENKNVENILKQQKQIVSALNEIYKTNQFDMEFLYQGFDEWLKNKKKNKKK